MLRARFVRLAIFLVSLVLARQGGALAEISDDFQSAAGTAALTSEQTRQPQYDDFLRLIYLPTTLAPPTTLGTPSAYRVFFGATIFYEPPITIAQIANFSGIPVRPAQNLYILRCSPQPGSDADPTLSLWPNLISRILDDYELHKPLPDSADAAIQAIAASFKDTSSHVLTEPLENALRVGKQFFERYPQTGKPLFSATDMQNQMSKRFGTFSSFTGLGYAAEGTATSPSLDSEQTMRSMVIPDFILRNVSLAEAGCYCIQVKSTVPNRDQQKLDPDFILHEDNFGRCMTVTQTSD